MDIKTHLILFLDFTYYSLTMFSPEKYVLQILEYFKLEKNRRFFQLFAFILVLQRIEFFHH